MGAGTSKGTVRIVTAGTTSNAAENQGNDNNFMNAEQQRQSFHPVAESQSVENRGVMDLPITSDKFNVKTVSNFKALEKLKKHQGQATQDGEPRPSSDSLLTSFKEKYPAVAETLNTIYGHYQALKAALNSANLGSKATLDEVKGLFSVYFKQKAPKDRNAMIKFAVALGVPKLAYEMIIDRRNNFPELTTWDREEDEEENIHKIMEGSLSETVGSTENQVEWGGGDLGGGGGGRSAGGIHWSRKGGGELGHSTGHEHGFSTEYISLFSLLLDGGPLVWLSLRCEQWFPQQTLCYERERNHCEQPFAFPFLSRS